MRFLAFFILVTSYCMAEDLDVWLKERLIEAGAIRERVERELPKEMRQCAEEHFSSESDGKILIFASFSMPESAWMSLSSEESVFVLRGLPNNNFNELAKRIAYLKERGFQSVIQIDPKLFTEYDITSVPTFVVRREHGFDKLEGNVSLQYVKKVLGEND